MISTNQVASLASQPQSPRHHHRRASVKKTRHPHPRLSQERLLVPTLRSPRRFAHRRALPAAIPRPQRRSARGRSHVPSAASFAPGSRTSLEKPESSVWEEELVPSRQQHCGEIICFHRRVGKEPTFASLSSSAREAVSRRRPSPFLHRGGDASQRGFSSVQPAGDDVMEHGFNNTSMRQSKTDAAKASRCRAAKPYIKAFLHQPHLTIYKVP